ncbi:cytochrome P450 family protein [Deinococcus maricopensis]|uniref:Peroxidase n=1 Tax=Deinococcus maricopensis (strain DSM 21211 / LMG 22137 / NRRL B-23946 / LB-34) TaxID=709986 RepID=E8U935_DEIML|nr:cytochrome P450 [Deinococcus maricopensis]ADV67574.1 Peroxidase [Deinococcus maricopensis DSM 21211]
MSHTTHPPLFSAAFKTDPYPTYAHFRDTQPVRRETLPDGRPLWLVTRYDDVIAAFKDPRLVKNPASAMPPEALSQLPRGREAFRVLSHHMLSSDPPDHTRLRRLVSRAFTPRYVEQMRPRVQAIADDLIDRMAEGNQGDLIEQLAFPLPITVISDMLGVPHEDRERFRTWSNIIVSVNPFEPQTFQSTADDLVAFTQYFRDLIAEKRARPTDDLTSELIHATDEGDALNEDELLSMMFLLLVAGHETTVNLIGNGTLALLTHPDQLAHLRADPTLIESAVEELLRYDGPVETSTMRWAAEDVQLGGATIPRGEAVLVVIASADRDPERFKRPEDLDITRAMNRHVAFGHGIHYCLGAPLARLEGQVAIGTLLQRFPDLRLDVRPEELQWRPGMLIRGLWHLPVRW